MAFDLKVLFIGIIIGFFIVPFLIDWVEVWKFKRLLDLTNKELKEAEKKRWHEDE